MLSPIKRALRYSLKSWLPLWVRKRLVLLINRQSWLQLSYRSWLASDLLHNWKDSDVNELHKFQWRHHLGYADSYEVATRFGYDNFNESRKLLFDDLRQHLVQRNLDPRHDIRSVFEVGCSLGYLLRYMETEVFPNATYIGGIDIDQYAIEKGRTYLEGLNSQIKLVSGDMESLEQVMHGRSYDMMLCTGVLMYLEQERAQRIVKTMLDHSNALLCMTGLAHPQTDNADLTASSVRERDATFVHNIDKMVHDAGGHVVFRRWEGAKLVDGNSIYFVFACKQRSHVEDIS